jgi:DNA-binding SARP family transcriptional activator
MNILMSKLITPSLKNVIPRERLHSVAKEISKKKLTVVTAGAGYGKSIFVVQTVEKLGPKNTWYRIDNTDNDLNIFLEYLVTGIREHYPHFLESQYTQEKIDFDKSSDKNNAKILINFLGEIEKTLTEDFFIVFDNYHIVQNNSEIMNFLQLLISRLPSLLHIIIISRREINLEISRLVAKMEVAQVAESELAFTKDEIKFFFSELFNVFIDKKNIDSLYNKTSGWVSGLILFYNYMEKKTGFDIGQSILNFKGSHLSVFKYIDENVYKGLSENIKEFLIKTSVFSQVNVEFCDQIFKNCNSHSMLLELEDNHLFTFSADEERMCFYYHNLLKEFLQAKLKIEFSRKDICDFYTKAAFLHEKHGRREEALKYHILAGSLADASRLLPDLARLIIKQGNLETLESLLSIMPESSMDNEPWFQYLQAGYFGLTNQVILSFKCYKNALQNFRSRNDEKGECICLLEVAEHYVTIGDFPRAELEYKRILTINKLEPKLNIITLGHLIKTLGFLRRTKEADKYVRKAVSQLSYLDDEKSLNMCQGWIDVARGYRYAFSENYQKAIELCENALPLFEDIGQYRLILASNFLIAKSCFYLGLFEKGREVAQEGMIIDNAEKLMDIRFSGGLRLLYIKNNLEIEGLSPGQLVKMFEDCKECLKSFKTISFATGMANAFLVLHKVHLEMGDFTGAEQSLRKGITIIENKEMPSIEDELKIALANSLVFKKDTQHRREAMIILKAAEKKLEFSGGWYMCWVARIYARYYWIHGHKETTFQYIAYCLTTSEKKHFDAWIVSEKEWIIPLLVELYAMGDMKDYIGKIFIKIGPSAEYPLMKLVKHKKIVISRAAAKIIGSMPKVSPPGIKAYFFKQFKVFVGERLVEEKEWKSKKAKTILKYLLCKRNTGYLDKEILMELLWPDEDPKKSAQRFHVALASLRKILEPDLPQGIRSSYIKRSGPGYRIDIGNNGIIDAEEFEKELANAKNAINSEKALKHYNNIELIYRGDFLEEDLYEDWCADEREKYKENHLFALTKIIEYFDAKSDYEGSINAANNYLKIDKYAEDIIRLLMKRYSMTGNKAMAIKIYEKSKKIIKKELCCHLSDETEALYRQLVSV